MNGGKIIIETVVDTSGVDKGIKKIQDKSVDVKLFDSKSMAKEVIETNNKVKNLNVNYGALAKKAKLVKDNMYSAKTEVQEIKEEVNKIKLDLLNPKNNGKNNGFEGMMKSAKKFALSLISIRGVYALLSKASQAYMSTDKTTTNQMEANWVGLGTILAPAIDLIVGLFKKAVTSILYFMSVLTGVNYIEKANTAILKKQTEATKELTKANDKLNASFDEMNVLQEPSSKGSEIDTNALFDISDIGESARKTIEKIGTALKPVYEKIKDIIKWALDNPEAILGILGGATLLTMLGKIIGVAGVGTTAGTGLSGILGLLLAIASIGVIAIEIKTIFDAKKKLDETRKITNSLYEDTLKNNEKLVDVFEEVKDQIDYTTESGKEFVKLQFEMAKKSLEQADANYKEKESWGLLETIKKGVSGQTKELTDEYYANIDAVYAQIEILSELYDQGALNEEQTKQYVDIMKRFKEQTEITKGPIGDLTDEFWLNSEQVKVLKERYKDVDKKLQEVSNSTDKNKQKTKELNKEIDNLPNKKTVNIDVKTENATKKTKGFLASLINDGIFAPINQLSKNLGLNFKIPYLATGGIINNPGSGVPLGMARGGEAGAEGVIPLTDAQAMETLGATIGKYISISATVPVYVGNRQIAREIKKINAENDFAMNR